MSETLDTLELIAILRRTLFSERKGATSMIRKFSSLAIWVVLAVAVALAPLACSSDSTSTDSGTDMTPA